MSVAAAGVRNSAPALVRDGAPAGVRNSAPALVRDGAPAGVRNSAPALVRDGAPAGVRNSAPALVRDGAPALVRNSALALAVPAPRVREGCALVTGASRGIGAAIACALAADGWPVAVNYRSDEQAAAATVARIEDGDGRALAVRADVTAPEEVRELFETTERELGRVLVLVNSAGVRHDDLAISLSEADWAHVIDTNLSAAFSTTKRALRGMIRERFGRVINLASVVGPRANAGQANYAAAKAGLIAMTKTIAVEVARRGVTVNAIAPGLIETDMTADLDGELLGAVPARRAGRPEEVAACARFLASEQASYVTGTTLYVDGGLAA
jgi:3-oxoacyl-[acyl-carrier protein] reductase